MTAPTSRSFERVAHCYDASRGGEARGRRMADDIEPRLGPRGTVLDVGVGTGVVSLAMTERGWRPLGVDLSPAMAARARDRIGDRVVIGDVQRLPVASGSVDGAFSVWVLHLVGDVGLVLEEVARVLRSRARYVIVPAGRRQEDTDPISAILDPVMEALEGERERHDTPPQVLELAEAAGFDVVGVERAPRHDYEDTPDEIARMVEQRAYSVLWDVPDDKWAEIVMPAVGALRSLPHPDLPLPRSSLTDLIVLERR